MRLRLVINEKGGRTMKNLMKEYESPILSVISFTQDDVIRTSNPGGAGGFGGEDDEFIVG